MFSNASHYRALSIPQLRPPRGVCEAHLHQAYKPCVIGAIKSQTYGNVWWRLTSRVLYHQPKESTTIHFDWFVMELLQWQNVYKIGEDEVLRPPVVALIESLPDNHQIVQYNYMDLLSSITLKQGLEILVIVDHATKLARRLLG